MRNTPYQYLPSRVEQASIETYAVKTRSLPPGGKSMLGELVFGHFESFRTLRTLELP